MNATTARTEAFSDGVFAIALTLLVLDLRPPTTGRFAEQLLDEWPVYAAYLSAFLTVGATWINHHALFLRVRRVDAAALVLNLGLLLGTSLIPWPTALISAAVRSGDRAGQTASVVVYGIVTVLVSVPWLALNLRLAGRPGLLETSSSRGWLRRNAAGSVGALVLAVAAIGLALVAPTAALVLLLVAPIVFLVANLRAALRDDRG